MAEEYPPINIEKFKLGVHEGMKNILQFFEAFQSRFNLAFDERGLTDRLLLAIVNKGGNISLVSEILRVTFVLVLMFSQLIVQTFATARGPVGI